MTNHDHEEYVRAVLFSHGPLRREELCNRIGDFPGPLELAIDRLGRRGEVIEHEGWLSLAGAAGATKTTDPTQPEPTFGEIYEHAKQEYRKQAYSDAQKYVLSNRVFGNPLASSALLHVQELVDAYNAMQAIAEEYPSLLADREALHALRAKLREMGKEE